jgi:SAM-dependent MidA family methyltransferase
VGDDALSSLLDEAGGWISFRRFMQEALYHPEHGYYTSAVREVGARGDFSTVASLHSVLGEAIARWALARRRELLPRGRAHLIEVGGGSGQLAQAVLRALGVRGRISLRYHIVEISEPLRRAQQRLLGRRVSRWHETVEAALEAAGGQALVFSNELVDAFPCHRLALRDGKWREVGLRRTEDGVIEEDGPLEDARALTELCSAPRALDEAGDGQRCEVHLPHRDWLVRWLPGLRRGALLTIDYGDTVEALYRGRPAGTVRAYFQHLSLTGAAVFGRFGRQDLTADINFTDLQAWGEAAGLGTRSLLSQEEFVRRWVPNLERRAEKEPALAYVTHPAGAGSAFKVLEQDRGVKSFHLAIGSGDEDESLKEKT